MKLWTSVWTKGKVVLRQGGERTEGWYQIHWRFPHAIDRSWLSSRTKVRKRDFDTSSSFCEPQIILVWYPDILWWGNSPRISPYALLYFSAQYTEVTGFFSENSIMLHKKSIMMHKKMVLSINSFVNGLYEYSPTYLSFIITLFFSPLQQSWIWLVIFVNSSSKATHQHSLMWIKLHFMVHKRIFCTKWMIKTYFSQCQKYKYIYIYLHINLIKN